MAAGDLKEYSVKDDSFLLLGFQAVHHGKRKIQEKDCGIPPTPLSSCGSSTIGYFRRFQFPQVYRLPSLRQAVGGSLRTVLRGNE